METFEAIIKRKGVRSFTDQKISDEQLGKLIHAANAAPISGGDLAARRVTSQLFRMWICLAVSQRQPGR